MGAYIARVFIQALLLVLVVVIDVSAERDSYGQVTKGLQWMPRSHLAKKAVVSCEKRRGRANIL